MNKADLIEAVTKRIGDKRTANAAVEAFIRDESRPTGESGNDIVPSRRRGHAQPTPEAPSTDFDSSTATPDSND